MIYESPCVTREKITDRLVFNCSYIPSDFNTSEISLLSPIAQKIIREKYPESIKKKKFTDSPDFIALRLLDYLSSRQGYIRRKGRTFRCEDFYRDSLPGFIARISCNEPLRLSSLCLCTTLANTRFAGQSPYPHMGSYIAIENIQKIAQGASVIYPPGIEFSLGFEGTLFRRLYFHNESVTHNALLILKELNEEAHLNVNGPGIKNPVQILDAVWMIEQTFGSCDNFYKHVEKQKHLVKPEDTAIWQAWYRRTVSELYFPSGELMDHFIEKQAKWRQVVYHYKFSGGEFGTS